VNVPDLDPINLTHAGPGENAPPVPAVPETPPSGPDGAIEWPHDPPTGSEYAGADPLVLAYHTAVTPAGDPVSGNVLDDRPHFLRVLPDGTEVCGQDGQPWECDGYRMIRESLAESSGVPADTATTQAVVPLETVALAMGVTVEDLQATMADHLARNP
jgi:hypothetical protein